MIDLEAIRARAEAATPPPWTMRPPAGEGVLYAVYREGSAGDNSLADSEFTVHAREDVPALVTEVERLQRRIEEYQAENGKLAKALMENGDRDHAEIERLRAALTFYADAATWNVQSSSDAFTPAELDEGVRARAALKQDQ